MLQLRAIEPGTLGLLKSLMQEPFLTNNFLVGGTALALQMGHRFSIDLDLFTHESFEAEQLLEAFREKYAIQPLTVTNTIFIAVVEGIKVDCVRFKYPFAFPIVDIEGVRMADIRDIASMKRSLTYYEDAEQTEMPVVFDKKVTWVDVKKRMVQVVRDNF